MDEETKKLLSEVEMIKHTMETPGWSVIERRMNGLIEDICNIRNIDKNLDTEERLRQLEIRDGSAELVEKWFESIKGDAEWADPMNTKTLTDELYKTK